MLIQKVFDVFGENLPDKDTFFATSANPMVLLDLRREGWNTWENFVNEYSLFVKSKVSKSKEKVLETPKGVTK